MSVIEVKKGQILQYRGDLNTKAYHVKSGLLRSYTIDEKGKEHIFMFAPEDWIIADNVSGDEACELFIDALEDTVAEVVEKDINADFDVMKLIRRIGVMQRRIIRLLSAPAVERYDNFVATYPDIVQRVPQKMIASYLGITPEALSKVKRAKMKAEKS